MNKRDVCRSYASVRKQILEAKHYFQLLGVYRNCTIQELSWARRTLMKYVHPDVNSASEAHRLSALVNSAHATLETHHDAYLATLGGKTCTGCNGHGVTKKQRGFHAVVSTSCAQCHGAGVL